MSKFKHYSRYIFHAAAYLCLAAVLFAGGYAIGRKNGGGLLAVSPTLSEEGVPSQTPLPFSEPTEQPEENTSRYRVVLEDDQLRLYLDEDGLSRLISSEEISIYAYPEQDINALQNGKNFSTLGEAMELMENFLS